jgi:hypothetical protein
MSNAKAIRATFTREMRKSYRTLRRNARKLGRVLIYNADPDGWELALIDPREADDPNWMHNRTILFDPRSEQ